MVSWWFGARWFGIPRIPLWKELLLRNILGIQTTNPNHQLVFNWNNPFICRILVKLRLSWNPPMEELVCLVGVGWKLLATGWYPDANSQFAPETWVGRWWFPNFWKSGFVGSMLIFQGVAPEKKAFPKGGLHQKNPLEFSGGFCC